MTCKQLSSTHQVPTPPPSEAASPCTPNPSLADGGVTVAVSTAFFPGAQIDSMPADLILASSDVVFFYVHSHKLLSSSNNKFNNLLRVDGGGCFKGGGNDVSGIPLVSVAENSAVLNILLHTLYYMPFSQYTPTLDILLAAVAGLKKYGMQVQEYVTQGTHLFQHLLLHAPLNPLEVYILAGSHDLQGLAVASSAHLLSFQLCNITDEMAQRMGPVYLKRLFFLHLGRIEALKRLLTAPPTAHEPTLTCNFMEQKEMVRAWALAAAYLAWDAKPDLPVSTVRQTMQPLADKLTCASCRQAMSDRIKQLITQWSAVKVAQILAFLKSTGSS
ncbi:hypothetical protein OE88DRAFT_1631272 [Heliocybe sulcata]|uniref:BTB domain-containing protein n=1 Tax=Heliocybe sulcata TaxID=5364 RepID=A0A5C3N9T0_9AGAM|nr:hypothetical protein OE88DRAFT_1631272 [Heliocybe sulcata]